MPKISVIIPVYNAEELLLKCIESILAQTYTDWELILVDDGSPDNSGSICDDYVTKDQRIKVIHKPNGGVSSARNTGIDIATGEWLCFVDSDDWVEKTYLEDFGVVNNLSDIIICGYKKVRDGVVTLKTIVPLTSDTDKLMCLAEDYNIINSPCFKLYRTNIVTKYKIRFDQNISYGEDHLFSLTYLTHTSNISNVESCGYNYRETGQESLTNRDIPLNHLLYYSKHCIELQQESSCHTRSYEQACNRRNVSVLVRVYKAMANSDYDRKRVISVMPDSMLRNLGISGLSLTETVFALLAKVSPYLVVCLYRLRFRLLGN